MEDYNLKVTFDKKDADYWRMEPNSLWKYIKEDIDLFFGPLACVIKGQIKMDTKLADCYIKDFKNHVDEKKYSTALYRIISEDVNIYSDIQEWINSSRTFLRGIIGHYQEYNPFNKKNHSSPHFFTGRKGVGKTSLLLFTRDELEEKRKCICIFIHARTKGIDLSLKYAYIKNQIINELDDSIESISEELKIKKADVIQVRFERYWKKLLDDTIDDTKISNRTKNEMCLKLMGWKYSIEFYNYVKDSIKYLKDSLGYDLVIMIDDLDHAQNEIYAKDICSMASDLATKLDNVPIMVSIREETLAKLDDSGISDINKERVIPPSFARVLNKRYDNFMKKYDFNKEIEKCLGMSKEDFEYFIQAMVFSFLEKESYSNLIIYSYDLDILLDAFRCVVSSPFIDPLKIAKEYKNDKRKKVHWHVILDSMQRYIYANFYSENSFFLNVFDNNEIPPTVKNTLIRIRLMQVLAYLYEGLNKKCNVGEIYSLMLEIGYPREQVFKALQAFARQRLIITWKEYNYFDGEVSEILIHRRIVYYLNGLIFRYRYLQNILPVTPIPFLIPLEIANLVGPYLNDKKKLVSVLIYKFINFIKECEREENNNVKNKEKFKEITRDIILSKKIKSEIDNEIIRMKRFKQLYYLTIILI